MVSGKIVLDQTKLGEKTVNRIEIVIKYIDDYIARINTISEACPNENSNFAKC